MMSNDRIGASAPRDFNDIKTPGPGSFATREVSEYRSAKDAALAGGHAVVSPHKGMRRSPAHFHKNE